ncbi:hypothetical protein NPIL_504331 [Nephila pilipes]|uniref:Uncharacterized protein n=1 Tax=Nephila pilipes TaxID=299642 RepID=A0A8X6TM75_NEPPI|nr:hypothetical protein NPIL_504331 [Nephila pilipes]
MPQKQFAFGEHANNQHPVDNLDVNLCTLREEEGRCLNTTQKEKLVAVLKKSSPNDNLNENSVFQHINDHDLFAGVSKRSILCSILFAVSLKRYDTSAEGIKRILYFK